MSEHENYAYILNYLPNGYSKKKKNKPVARAVGEKYFTLLELEPKKNLDLYERVYIGKDYREKIAVVLGTLNYEELTIDEQNELKSVLKKIIEQREKHFTKFFNKSGYCGHGKRTLALSHLPNIGEKKTTKILEERDKKPFKSFNDIKRRTNVKKPKKIIKKKTLTEIKEKERLNMFVGPDKRF